MYDDKPPLDDETRAELLVELEQLINRMEKLRNNRKRTLFNPGRYTRRLRNSFGAIAQGIEIPGIEQFRAKFGLDLRDPDTWKGIWIMLKYTLEYQTDVLKRRLSGDYEIDEWGLDYEVMNTLRPFLEFMVRSYWRVEASGIQNIPDEGKGILIVSHTGLLPWDSVMVATAVQLEHPSQRLVRSLYGDEYPGNLILSRLLVKSGQVVASEENCSRLLRLEQLVALYPEDAKSRRRYQKGSVEINQFMKGGYIRVALQEKAPIIPVSITGTDENYISLGPIGLIPMFTRRSIDVGEPIVIEPTIESIHDEVELINNINSEIKDSMRKMIFNRFSRQRPVF
jgi:1-acyl-sn-glycerol-3-phosphate acyltransferase